MQLNTEQKLIFAVGLILSFLALTFDDRLGLIYLGFIILSFMGFTIFKKYYGINNIFKNTGSQLLIALGGVVVFFGISYFLSIFLQSAIPLLEGNFVVEYLKMFSAQTPILAGNKILTFIVFGFIVAFVETLIFYIIGLNAIRDITGEPSRGYFSFSTIIVGLFLSAVFTIFHFQVRGLSNNVGLIGTFIFGLISYYMILWSREGEPAIWFHIIWNSLIASQKLFGPLEFLNF